MYLEVDVSAVTLTLALMASVTLTLLPECEWGRYADVTGLAICTACSNGKYARELGGIEEVLRGYNRDLDHEPSLSLTLILTLSVTLMLMSPGYDKAACTALGPSAAPYRSPDPNACP